MLSKKNKHFRHWRRKYPLRALLRQAQRRSWARGTRFDLTEDDLKIPTHCPVLGVRMKQGGRKFKDNAPTIDEIVPGRGYIKGNVAIICWRANRLKSDATVKEVRAILRYMEERWRIDKAR
jgi:hypothetical protein